MKALVENRTTGQAHCPICTHNVPADIVMVKGKFARVIPGQRCPRCRSSLDVAVVIQVPEAA
ncbi:MAG TPA: hypothetical protein VMH81_24845 [Bryobacteraceae bacterium]|nr:hypothetical protein [Bryobacteraceae bacterium]